ESIDWWNANTPATRFKRGERSPAHRTSCVHCCWLEGAADTVVTGRPTKSRSLLGSQFQKRHALTDVSRPGPTTQSTVADTPPRSWLDLHAVSVSVRRSNAL